MQFRRSVSSLKGGLCHLGALLFSAVIAAFFTWWQQGRPFGADFPVLWGLIWFQMELFYWLGVRFFAFGPDYTSMKDTRRILRRLVVFFVIVLALSAAINLLVIVLTSLWRGGDWQKLLPRIIQQEYLGFFQFATIGILIGAVIFFYFQWQDALQREQKLREEKLIFQYETLKNQVNPHFLFNSLNALASLVHQDAGLSERFIQKLSFIYRYILEHKDQDFVDLASEIDFVKDYFYLLQIRGQEKIELDFQIGSTEQYQILPISLQLLVENALKHNTASRQRPLRICIRQKGDWVIVTNNLQKKTSLEHTSKLGLKNLAERVRLTMGKEIKIMENGEKFTVEIPLSNSLPTSLKTFSYESADHRG